MKNQQIETSDELLNIIKGLIAEARKNEFVLDSMVEEVEGFLYGNLLQNIFNNLLDDNNKNDLYKAIHDFLSRERRFGTVTDQTKSSASL